MRSLLRLLIPACAMLAVMSMTAGCGSVYRPPAEDLLGSASPPGLTARFFGVTTLLISDGDKSIMIDGFFSRPGIFEALLPLRPHRGRIDKGLEGIDHIDALLVAHGHHDHAMDAPIVAIKKGALLAGSESVANVARRWKLSESRICSLKDRDTFSVGKFQITVLTTPHSKGWPQIPGELQAPLPRHATMWDYLPGENYNYLLEHPLGNILITTSAGKLKPDVLGGARADVVFLAIGRLSDDDDPETVTAWYWSETVQKTGAKLVIPVHWDDFVMGPRNWPLAPPPKFVDDVHRSIDAIRGHASRSGVQLKFMEMLKQPIALPVGGTATGDDEARRAFSKSRTVRTDCSARL